MQILSLWLWSERLCPKLSESLYVTMIFQDIEVYKRMRCSTTIGRCLNSIFITKVSLQKKYKRGITAIFAKNMSSYFFFFLGGNKMKTASISNQIPGSHGNSLYMFLDHFINFHNFSGAGLNTKFKKKTSTITMWSKPSCRRHRYLACGHISLWTNSQHSLPLTHMMPCGGRTMVKAGLKNL